MKKLMIIAIITIVTIYSALSEINRKENYPPERYCYARSTLNIIAQQISGGAITNDCEIRCPEGYLPKCTASFFSASCTCEQQGNPSQPNFVIPSNITNEQLQIATDFINFCNQSQSTAIQTLGSYVNSAKDAINQNNQGLYASSEIQYDSLFDQLLSSELAEIENWIINYAQNYNN